MRLKRLLVGLRSRRGVPAGGGGRKAPLVPSGAPASVLHFRGEPANGGCFRLGGRLGRWLRAPARRAYGPGVRQSGGDRGERCGLSHVRRGPALRGRLRPLRRGAGRLGAPRAVPGHGLPVPPVGGVTTPRAEVVGVRMAASDPS